MKIYNDWVNYPNVVWKKKLTNKLRITNVLFNYQIKYTQLAFLLLRK